MFTPAIKNSVFLSKLKVSREKVEKVVNPPQNPIPINSLRDGLISSFSSNPNIIKPSIMLPKRLTARVPKGKYGGNCFCT